MNDEIFFARHGRLAVATLNRPAALNAQNLGMVRALTAQLDAWEADPAVTHLLIHGVGERAFCAGGDIRQLWQMGEADQHDFFSVEYELCYRLAKTRLVTIAYMDGVTMGGGVGLSIFADHRLATPRTVWAMPEVQIGFFPDIAGLWFLPRVKAGSGLGRYLGITGARLSGGDCLQAGIATQYVGEGIDDALIAALQMDDALDRFSIPTPQSELMQKVPALNEMANTPLPEFLDRLRALGLLLPELETAICPFSMALVDRGLAIGARLSYRATVELDFRLVKHFLRGATFREGVTSHLLERRPPDWPAIPLEDAEMLAYFQ